MNTNAKPVTPLPWVTLPYKNGWRSFEEIKMDDAYELHAANAYPRLVKELQNIANADPSKWDDDMRDQFREWAQNRANSLLHDLGEA